MVAQISKGFITKLRPIACPNCDEKLKEDLCHCPRKLAVRLRS